MFEIENDVMYRAVSDMLEQYGAELIEKYKDVEDISPSPSAVEKFKQALNRE